MGKFYFFRHAQASYGASNYDQLSERGEEQAVALGQYLLAEGKEFDRIYVGPLRRQQHTYEIVAAQFAREKRALPEPVVLEGLREHAGPEGMRQLLPDLIETVPYIRSLLAEVEAKPTLRKRNTLLAFQYFMEQWVVGNVEVPGIQSWQGFREVVRGSLETILQEAERGQTLGVFTSGGTIAAITAEALHLSKEERVAAMNFSIRNTSFTTFLAANNQFNLLSFNELPHLPKELISFV